jgi:hypothetical protein
MGFGGLTTQLSASANQLKTSVVPQMKSAMMDLSVVMQQTFMSAVDAFGQGVHNLAAGTLDLESAGKGILKAFGGFISQMGKLIFAYGIGMISLKKVFANPIGAIVAGAAMIAIGAAISGLASRGPAIAGGAAGGGGGATLQLSGAQTVVRGRDIVTVFERGTIMRDQTT